MVAQDGLYAFEGVHANRQRGVTLTVMYVQLLFT